MSSACKNFPTVPESGNFATFQLRGGCQTSSVMVSACKKMHFHVGMVEFRMEEVVIHVSLLSAAVRMGEKIGDGGIILFGV